MKKILVIDDDLDMCQLLKAFLGKNGFEVNTVSSGSSAIRTIDKTYDLVLCDVRLPDIDGLEILSKIKEMFPYTVVIMITGYSDVRTAVTALRKGAVDYVTKPLHPDEILHQIKELTEKSSTAGRAGAIATSESKPEEVGQPKKMGVTAAASIHDYVIGNSDIMLTINKNIELVAPTDMSVIILGETGTGKEYVAKRIHTLSPRANKPFVALDCGALPQELAGSELFGHKKGAFTGAVQDKIGHFEMANEGTLFIDEIGNLSYENQVKLLRVLQERKVKKIGDTKEKAIDIRLVVATNENLRLKIKEGKFREDLYHRLNEFNIEMPPLRDRGEDVLLFASHFLNLANSRLNKSIKEIAEEIKKVFNQYSWPGNLRELNNVIKRSVLLSNTDVIKKASIPPELFLEDFPALEGEERTEELDLKTVAEEAEKKAIIASLKKYQFNKTKVAKALNVDRKTLYNKINAYGIEV